MQSKLLVLVGWLTLGTALDAADSITTRHGITYTNAVIQRADPDGLVIEYAPQQGSVGLAKLKFTNLPEDLQKRYNYSAADADAFEQNQAAGIARREEAIAQAETEKRRRHDELVDRRAKEEAALEARQQAAAALSAAQSQMEGGYGGGYDYGDSGWHGPGRKHVRHQSTGPHPSFEAIGLSSGVSLSGLGTGWGNSGHWGPLPSPPPPKSSQNRALRQPARRGNSPGLSSKLH